MEIVKIVVAGMGIVKRMNILLILLVLTALPVHAGWVVTTQEDMSYYGKGFLRQVPSSADEGPESIMDFSRGTATMLNHGSRTYTTFRFDEFCQLIKKMYTGITPEMLAMIKQMNAAKPKPDVSIKRIGKGETIAGFATTRYQVTNNGHPDRVLWLAEDPRLKKYNNSFFDQAMDGIREMSRCDDIGMSGESVDTSPAYLKLMKTGWLMKEELVNKAEEGATSQLVINLVEKDLPASTFSVPQGYRKVPLSQFDMGN